MLPFLKNRDDVAVMGPVETIEREPDEGVEMDMLDAVAADILHAIEKKDKSLLKGALEAFAEHLQGLDEQQDQEAANAPA